MTFSDRSKEPGIAEKPSAGLHLSADGKLLVTLLVVILVGPYLPQIPLVDESFGLGVVTKKVRLDHFLLPMFASFVIFRTLGGGGLYLPGHIRLYGLFFIWLLFVTTIWYGDTPLPSGQRTISLISLAAGLDAYSRPLMMLIITANLRVSRDDLIFAMRAIMITAVPIALIAALQLLPATEHATNEILENYYSNASTAGQFKSALSGGRVASVMPQLSTLGMYMVLTLGLMLVQPRLTNSLRLSNRMLILVGAAVLVGGVLSGSKVFIVGSILLVVFYVISQRGAAGLKVRHFALGGIVTFVVLFAISSEFPSQAGRFRGKLDPRNGVSVLYNTYVAPRFDPDEGKVVRSGAVSIVKEYPLSGLGMNAVGQTTDSMLFGILVLGGLPAGILYLFMMGAVGLNLMRIAKNSPDRDLAALAAIMGVLTVVFFLVAVGFHTFIQDRAGDAYWLMVGLLLGSLSTKAIPRKSLWRNQHVTDEAEFVATDSTS